MEAGTRSVLVSCKTDERDPAGGGGKNPSRGLSMVVGTFQEIIQVKKATTLGLCALVYS